MRSSDAEEQARQEDVIELAQLVHLAQEMGRRLANESHGEQYDLVREVNEMLHRIRVQIELIQSRSSRP